MISIDIPKNGNIINLDKEISLVTNIKDKTNMKQTLEGLLKIKKWCQENNPKGKSFRWDNKELFVNDYEKGSTTYYCGNRLLDSNEERKYLYHLFLFDLKQCTLATIYVDGFELKYNKKSNVQSKHRQGGQSSQRFERERQNQINKWLKKVYENFNSFDGIAVVGCNEYYRKKFIENTESFKIKRFYSSEYFDESGVQQYINKLQ